LYRGNGKGGEDRQQSKTCDRLLRRLKERRRGGRGRIAHFLCKMFPEKKDRKPTVGWGERPEERLWQGGGKSPTCKHGGEKRKKKGRDCYFFHPGDLIG